MPGLITLSWLALLLPPLPLILVRRNMRSLPSLRARVRTRQRGIRLRPAKRTRLLRHHRTRRRQVKNKLRKERFFRYSLHTIMRTVPVPWRRTAEEIVSHLQRSPGQSCRQQELVIQYCMLYVDCSSRASASVHAVQNVAPSPFDQYKAGFSPLTTVLSMSTCRIFWAASGT
jgi:hypothetical protein